MDPVTTTLVAAFVAGAAKGAGTKAGEKAISDAYAALKGVIAYAYHHAADLLKSIAAVEEKPESGGRRTTLAEELKAAHAVDDDKLVGAAEAVLAAAEKSPSAQTIGIDWQDVHAARLKIGQIRARTGAVGWRVARSELSDIEIADIDVSGKPGK